MDYQNAEFYKLNKNNPDLVYTFADETITYRKEKDENGNPCIVEYRRKNGKRVTTRRIVSNDEMSIEDFDTWKARLTEEALEYRRYDDLTTRQNVSIENLLETDLVSTESVEEEYLRQEADKYALPKDYAVINEILGLLTEKQRGRYYKAKALGMSSRTIAKEECCDQSSVLESISGAEKKIQKELKKGDIITQKTFCSDMLTHKRVKNTGQLPQHYITDHHPAIIEREFFDRVQAEYARRNAKKKASPCTEETPKKSRYSSKYALTELLVCGDCGCPYRRCTWARNGQKKIVWRCTTRLEYGKDKCPSSPTIGEEQIHKSILKALSNLIEDKDTVKDELKAALGNALIDTGTDICIASLEAQLKEQENDMMRVVKICAERGNQKDFEDEFKRISANISDLRKIIEVEKTKIRPSLDIDSRLDRLFTQITEASADISNFEDGVIRQLIAQIRVDSAEELTIILHNGFRTKAVV